jgi:hypothetical protein
MIRKRSRIFLAINFPVAKNGAEFLEKLSKYQLSK